MLRYVAPIVIIHGVRRETHSGTDAARSCQRYTHGARQPLAAAAAATKAQRNFVLVSGQKMVDYFIENLREPRYETGLRLKGK